MISFQNYLMFWKRKFYKKQHDEAKIYIIFIPNYSANS